MIKKSERKLADNNSHMNSQNARIIGRRAFVSAIAAIPAIIAFGYAERSVTVNAAGDSPDSGASGIVKVSIVEFTDTGKGKGVLMVDKEGKKDAECREELPPGHD